MNPDEKQLEVEAEEDYERMMAHNAIEEAAMSNPYNEEDLAAGHEEAMRDREAAIKAARDKLYTAIQGMARAIQNAGVMAGQHPDNALDALADLDSWGVL